MNTQNLSAVWRAVGSPPAFRELPAELPATGTRPPTQVAGAFTARINLPNICGEPKGRTFIYPILFLSTLLSVLPVLQLTAQVLDWVDPVETAFAGSTTARSSDPRLAWRNPAALGNLEKRFNILAAFAPSVLGIEGYREGAFTAAATFGKHLAVGLSGAGLGAGAYQEFSGGATAASTIANNLRIGASLIARSASIDEYGSQIVPLLDLGAQIDVTPWFTVGASFVNATRTTLADEEIPQRLAMGMLFSQDSTFSLSMDVLQELRSDLGVGIGLSLLAVDGLTLRAGLATAPRTLGYGIGYQLGDIRVDYGGAYVAPLGYSHVFGVGVAW